MSREDVIATAAARFHAHLQIITEAAVLTEQERRTIPPWWVGLIGLEPAAAVRLTVERWNTELPEPLLARFVQVLAQRGIDVVLTRVASAEHTGLGLVYAIKSPGEADRYVCGLPPVAEVSEPASSLPASFATFYTTMHAGMYFELHVADALIKPQDLMSWREWLDGDELSFFDTPPEVPPSPDTLYVVCNDYGGAMILADTDPTATAVWATDVGMLDDRSYRVGSTWELIDEWLYAYFTPPELWED